MPAYTSAFAICVVLDSRALVVWLWHCYWCPGAIGCDCDFSMGCFIAPKMPEVVLWWYALSNPIYTTHRRVEHTHTQTPWCVKYIEHLTLIIKNIAFWYQKLLAALINWEHSFSELISIYKIVTWGFRSSVPPPSLRHTLYHSLSSILFTFRGWLVCVCAFCPLFFVFIQNAH